MKSLLGTIKYTCPLYHSSISSLLVLHIVSHYNWTDSTSLLTSQLTGWWTTSSRSDNRLTDALDVDSGRNKHVWDGSCYESLYHRSCRTGYLTGSMICTVMATSISQMPGSTLSYQGFFRVTDFMLPIGRFLNNQLATDVVEHIITSTYSAMHHY